MSPFRFVPRVCVINMGISLLATPPTCLQYCTLPTPPGEVSPLSKVSVTRGYGFRCMREKEKRKKQRKKSWFVFFISCYVAYRAI